MDAYSKENRLILISLGPGNICIREQRARVYIFSTRKQFRKIRTFSIDSYRTVFAMYIILLTQEAYNVYSCMYIKFILNHGRHKLCAISVNPLHEPLETIFFFFIYSKNEYLVFLYTYICNGTSKRMAIAFGGG